MRRNWSVKVERRRLREQVIARVIELCGLSTIGRVSMTPEREKQYSYTCFNVLGEAGIRGRIWIDFSSVELKELLGRPLYPVKPKAPLSLLAEAGK